MAKQAMKAAEQKAEHKIEEFAEDLGKMLGSAKAKAEGWLGQRQTIVKHLSDIRDTASKLLTDLGHQAESIVRRGRKPASAATAKRGPGRPAGSGNPAGSGKKKRTMS